VGRSRTRILSHRLRALLVRPAPCRTPVVLRHADNAWDGIGTPVRLRHGSIHGRLGHAAPQRHPVVADAQAILYARY